MLEALASFAVVSLIVLVALALVAWFFGDDLVKWALGLNDSRRPVDDEQNPDSIL